MTHFYCAIDRVVVTYWHSCSPSHVQIIQADKQLEGSTPTFQTGRSLGVGCLRHLDALSSTGAGQQLEQPLVTKTTADEFVFRQHAVPVNVHPVEDLLSSHRRHLTVFSRSVVRH